MSKLLVQIIIILVSLSFGSILLGMSNVRTGSRRDAVAIIVAPFICRCWVHRVAN